MFKQYRRSQLAELRPYVAGETLPERVSVSAADRENGSPRAGDMIARNPKNHDDQWLVAEDYFADNFETVTSSRMSSRCDLKIHVGLDVGDACCVAIAVAPAGVSREDLVVHGPIIAMRPAAAREVAALIDGAATEAEANIRANLRAGL